MKGIKVLEGKYVRTNTGVIRKVKTINTILNTVAVFKQYAKKYGFDNVPKSRTLINGCIDLTDVSNYGDEIYELVEVGDIVEIQFAGGNEVQTWLVDDEKFLEGLKKSVKDGDTLLLKVLTKEKFKKEAVEV